MIAISDSYFCTTWTAWTELLVQNHKRRPCVRATLPRRVQRGRFLSSRADVVRRLGLCFRLAFTCTCTQRPAALTCPSTAWCARAGASQALVHAKVKGPRTVGHVADAGLLHAVHSALARSFIAVAHHMHSAHALHAPRACSECLRLASHSLHVPFAARSCLRWPTSASTPWWS